MMKYLAFFLITTGLFFTHLSSSTAEEYEGPSIRSYVEAPVDLQLNDGNPLRIRTSQQPQDPLKLSSDEQDEFEDTYGDLPTWRTSAFQERQETLFAGKVSEDTEDAPGAAKVWREIPAGQTLVERTQLKVREDARPVLERISAFESSRVADNLSQDPHDEMPWNSGVWNWINSHTKRNIDQVL